MVRALLAGTKTQTRRIVKGSPVAMVRMVGADDLPSGEFGFCATHERVINRYVRCPYGVPGDLLWVREACWLYGRWIGLGVTETGRPKRTFRLTGQQARYDNPGFHHTAHYGGAEGWSWRPGIHMPRWAGRIALRITDVRVERLQDISEHDARREGLQVKDREWMPSYRGADELPWCAEFPRDAYQDLWNRINGPGSWEANPWVWAVSFQRAKASGSEAEGDEGNPARSPHDPA